MVALDHPYIAGLTLCGGEPMELENQRELINVLRIVHNRFPHQNIWCYTGYSLDDLLTGSQHCEVTDELLSYIDVLIDGKFILELRDVSDNNRWRGSTNQRVIDLRSTLALGELTLVKGIPNNTL